jgi:hypothetical protein
MPENTLKKLLEAMRGRRGFEYLIASRAVRRYIDEVSVEVFESEIDGLEQEDVGKLLSVGVHSIYWKILIPKLIARGEWPPAKAGS